MAYRSRVLAALRELHRAKREVFEGDSLALEAARRRIQAEFRKNKSETDPAKIDEALTLATEVSQELRTSVVQLRQKDDETFELRLRKSTVLPENTPYDPAKEMPVKSRRKKYTTNKKS